MLKEIEEMICFASVCEEGSITGAAKALKCSKSQISRKIDHMEQRYGIKLFHRTTRNIEPTNAGLSLKDEAIRLYGNHKKLNHMAQHIHESLMGDFIITAPNSMSIFLLAPIIPLMKAKFPKINFQIIVSNSPLDLISNGIDLAIRSNDVVDESLVARQIGSTTEKIYVNKDFYNSGPLISSPLDLNQHELIINPYSVTNNVISLENGTENIPIDPLNCTLVNHYHIILDVIKNSNCVGALPDYAANEAEKAGCIVNILPEWHTNQWPVFLVNTYQMPVPRKLKEIRNFISAQLPLISNIFHIKG